jgi:hypothetical protein
MKHTILNREWGPVRTVIVLGAGRGGTSLVSGTLRVLGVCMGNDPHPLKHEWSPVAYLADGSVDVATTFAAVRRMDRTYDWWGWKSPRDVFWLESILPVLHDPGFVVVTRDIFDVSLSGELYQEVPLRIGFLEAAFVYHEITKNLRFWPWPALIMPFLGASAEPEKLVEVLCSFLELTPSPAARAQALNFIRPGPNSYRPIDTKASDPPIPASPEDVQADIQRLAADLSERHGTEYERRLDMVLTQARTIAGHICDHAHRPAEMASALAERLLVLSQLVWEADVSLHYDIEQLHTVRGSKELLRAILRIVDDLAAVGQDASAQVRERERDSGYRDLNALCRVLQIAIRVRNELQRLATLDEKFLARSATR